MPSGAASICRALISKPRGEGHSLAVLSGSRAERLRSLLDGLRSEAALARRVADDPVELVHQFKTPGDQEVAGLFCACLAYGRVDLFKPVLRQLLASLGPSPRDYCLALAERLDFSPFAGLVYRFNVGADLAALAWAIGDALREHGSLESLFLSPAIQRSNLQGSLAAFSGWLRSRPQVQIRRALGPPRALHHLLPDAGRGAATKRLLLYLRWMVRPADGVDLGAWTRLSPAALLIPVDTHVARMARQLGLTRRRDLSWRTAEEITASLRLLDPQDPTKYDFTLCHFGMSGRCPPRRQGHRCRLCPLLDLCGPGQGLARLSNASAARRSAPAAAAGKSMPSAKATVRAKVSKGSG